MSQPLPLVLCADCGANTAPCTGKRGCRHAGRWEVYMVHDRVWTAAGMPFVWLHTYTGESGYLCIGCLERRLGRELRPTDFTDAPINVTCPWDTPLLASRKRVPA